MELAQQLICENMAKAKRANLFDGKRDKLWHPAMHQGQRSANGLPLYDTPGDVPLYDTMAAQHSAQKGALAAVLRRRKLEIAVQQRKLAKQYFKYKKRYERAQAAMQAAAAAKKSKKQGKKGRQLHRQQSYEDDGGGGSGGGGGGGGGGYDDGSGGYGVGGYHNPSPRSNVVNSEAEFQAIMHSLQTGDKHCTVPPMMASKYQPPPFLDNNGLVMESARLLAERKLNMRWSEQEVELFYEKFAQVGGRRPASSRAHMAPVVCALCGLCPARVRCGCGEPVIANVRDNESVCLCVCTCRVCVSSVSAQHERHEERFAKIAHALQKMVVLPPCTKKHGDVVQFYYKNKKTPEFSKQLKRQRNLKSKMKAQAQAQVSRHLPPQPSHRLPSAVAAVVHIAAPACLPACAYSD
eukprot:COSAG05_NODE_329_length_11294_cov_59.570076_10_plen_408_part_00